jgi:GNAT superfamily N-acetyltransferase
MSGGAESQVRRAGAEDAGELARLLHAFNVEYDEPTPPPETLAERLRELLAGDAVVALLADRPAAGVAVLRLRPALWTRAADAYLEELYVVPERRRQGLGRALLEQALATARGAGADHFELTTAETDTEARTLYESVGMTNFEGSPDGPRMLYYELDL